MNNDDFLKISIDVAYEFYMLEGCISHWQTSTKLNTPDYNPLPHEPELTFQTNLYIEGIANHARVLIWFFCDPPSSDPKKDDVSAITFFDIPSKWQLEYRPHSPLFEEALTWANKRLAHMTLSRTQPKPNIDFFTLRKALLVKATTFCSLAPPERIDDKLRDVINKLNQLP